MQGASQRENGAVENRMVFGWEATLKNYSYDLFSRIYFKISSLKPVRYNAIFNTIYSEFIHMKQCFCMQNIQISVQSMREIAVLGNEL